MQMQITQFDKLKSEIATKLSPSLAIVVKCKDSASSAILLGKEAKHFSKLIEEKRKELVKPLNEQVDAINAYAKSLQEMPLKVESKIKTELLAFEKTLAAEREAEAKRLAEEAEKQKAELAKKQKEEKDRLELAAEFGTDDDAALKRQEIAAKTDMERESSQLEKSIKSQAKSIASNKVAGTKTVWKFEVKDQSLVPREFLVVDETAIRKAMNAGNREIAGVYFYEDTQIALR